jgi:hypothetical protein
MHHPFNEDLKETLDSMSAYNFLPEGTWMEGGCTLLAMSLQRLVPDSELYSVGRLDGGIPDHTILKVTIAGEQLFIDYDGLHSESEMLDKVFEEWALDGVTIAPASMELLVDAGMLAFTESAPALANLIAKRIGIIDLDRLNLEWGEPASISPALS